ncbi:PQQ-binding-like beta-propeller repeat protein [Spirillospora sp. NPDC049024]
MIKSRSVVREMKQAAQIRRGLLAGTLIATVGLTGCGFGDEGQAPTWRAELEIAKVKATGATADSVILWADKTVIGLDRRTGRQRWSYRHPFERFSYAIRQVKVAGDVVVLTNAGTEEPGNSPGRGGWLMALDAATGRTLWKDSLRNGEVTVFKDAVYTSDCPKACTVSRRDLRTGRPSWTLPAQPDTWVSYNKLFQKYVNEIDTRPSGRHLLLLSKPSQLKDKRKPTATTVDATTGRRTAQVQYRSGDPGIASNFLVITEREGKQRSCRYSIGIHDLRHEKRQGRVRLPFYNSGRMCRLKSTPAHEYGTASDAFLFATRSARTQAFDLKTRKPRWTARQRGVPIGADERIVLTAHGTGEKSSTVRALDESTGQQMWQAGGASVDDMEFHDYQPLVGGSVLLWWSDDEDDQHGVVRDASTGKKRWDLPRTSHWHIQSGDNWFYLGGWEDGTFNLHFYDLSR